MTSHGTFERAVRNFLAQISPGERIETLAVATTLLVQLADKRSIEVTRIVVLVFRSEKKKKGCFTPQARM